MAKDFSPVCNQYEGSRKPHSKFSYLISSNVHASSDIIRFSNGFVVSEHTKSIKLCGKIWLLSLIFSKTVEIWEFLPAAWLCLFQPLLIIYSLLGESGLKKNEIKWLSIIEWKFLSTTKCFHKRKRWATQSILIIHRQPASLPTLNLSLQCQIIFLNLQDYEPTTIVIICLNMLRYEAEHLYCRQ